MRPNVIFINVDQMSAIDSIRAVGSPYVQTPAIDRLMANGRAFSRSYCADPVCGPSRACWWTGRYASEHGVALNETTCHPDMNDVALPPLLKAAGVKPFFIGKWHVPGMNVRDHFHVLHEASWWGELSDRDITSSACAFLDAWDGEEPFFLNLGFMNPHDICISPCNDHGRSSLVGGKLSPPYLRDGILGESEIPPLPMAFDYPEPEPFLQWAWNRHARLQQESPLYDELTWRMHRYNYHRWVEMVDAEIGTVLDALKSSRFRDNTWIIFTSDHGEGMSRHQIIGKCLFYREIVEVPLVIASLGEDLEVAKGTVDSEHLVSGIDLATTIGKALNADTSSLPHGLDLLPLARGEVPEHWRDFVYAECAFNSRMVCDGRYKYIRDYRLEDEDFRAPGPDTHEVFIEQFFDLHLNPEESRSFLKDPACSERLDHLRTIMDTHERSLQRRPIPGDTGRNWIRNKLNLCKNEGILA